MDWNNREKVTTSEQAVETLADFLGSYEVLSRLVNPSGVTAQEKLQKIYSAADSGDPRALIHAVSGSRDPIDEAESFAQKWGIPFNRRLLERMFQKIDHDHGQDDGYWTSSSGAC